jgi:hypothetical protein
MAHSPLPPPNRGDSSAPGPLPMGQAANPLELEAVETYLDDVVMKASAPGVRG